MPFSRAVESLKLQPEWKPIGRPQSVGGSDIDPPTPRSVSERCRYTESARHTDCSDDRLRPNDHRRIIELVGQVLRPELQAPFLIGRFDSDLRVEQHVRRHRQPWLGNEISLRRTEIAAVRANECVEAAADRKSTRLNSSH